MVLMAYGLKSSKRRDEKKKNQKKTKQKNELHNFRSSFLSFFYFIPFNVTKNHYSFKAEKKKKKHESKRGNKCIIKPFLRNFTQ